MIGLEKRKSVPISKEMVWEAYLEIKKKGKSAGIDGLDMKQFYSDRSRELYKVWNRMSSGSYFPPAVKRVEIPKKDGSKRPLGIPTISDRVAQTVVKNQIEERLEKIFHPCSYGYRPKRNAHMAIDEIRRNCWKYNWVIDLDIANFFEEIDHIKLLKALAIHIPERWIMMYLKRWLKCDVLNRGELEKRSQGTPQGGVISPILANLYLHYTFDIWFSRRFPGLRFTRYADDLVVHCKSEVESKYVLESISNRLKSCDLRMHPDKTKIVYCKDSYRSGNYPIVSFDFLSFTFQPRTNQNKKTGKLFLGFDCAMSTKSRTRILEVLRELKIQRMTCSSIVFIAQHLNPKIRGWIRYYGKYKGYSLSKIFRVLRIRLMRWAKNRYKRYKNKPTKAYEWLDRVRREYPNLFYHWQVGYSS